MQRQETPERLPIGQLLANLMRLFRAELAERAGASVSVTGIRPAHLPIFGTIKAGGSRLTELAARTDLSLSSAAELVDDLEGIGYVERRPDPSDGRAKLICLTEQGWGAIRTARAVIQEIESTWASAVGDESFKTTTAGLQDLLDALDPTVRRTYATPPGEP